MAGMDAILLANSPAGLAVIFPVFLLAGTIRGVAGLGLPTMAVGLLGIVMTPREAAALLVVPSLVTNVWQLAAGPAIGQLARRLWPMLAGIAAGGLAAFTLQVPARAERTAGPLVGLVTGVITAATGVFVIPAVPYLGGLKLERDALAQALGLAFTASTCALAASLLLAGGLRPGAAGLSLVALAPALGGMWLGQHLRGRIRPALFRRCFFVGLLALGIHLMLRPFMA
jgi:uncharacterized membrane protein YfcA